MKYYCRFKSCVWNICVVEERQTKHGSTVIMVEERFEKSLWSFSRTESNLPPAKEQTINSNTQKKVFLWSIPLKVQHFWLWNCTSQPRLIEGRGEEKEMWKIKRSNSQPYILRLSFSVLAFVYSFEGIALYSKWNQKKTRTWCNLTQLSCNIVQKKLNDPVCHQTLVRVSRGSMGWLGMN